MSDDNKERDLSPEEIEVNEVLEESTKQLAIIQSRIDNPPRLDDPKPAPSGGPPKIKWTPAMIAQRKTDFLHQQKTLIKDTGEKVDGILKESSLDVQLRSYQAIYKWQDKNLTEEINKADDFLKEGKPEPPDIVSKSQRITMDMLYQEKTNEEKIQEQKNTIEEKPDPIALLQLEQTHISTKPINDLETKMQNVITDYNLSLSYNNISEVQNPEKTDKSRETGWMENRDDLL